MSLRIRPALALSCLTALVTIFASGASLARAATGPVTFGPDLATLDVNNTNDCSVDPLIPWPGNPHTGAPSCTWTSSDPTNTNGGQLPPGDGTVSQVMVKVGAVTGPMQVVVMRAEFQEVDIPYIHYQISCCTDVGESAPFTPAANAITAEPVDLPVVVGDSDGTPGQYVVDLIGLSVLEDGVPVPAADETTLSPVNDQPGVDIEEPAMQDNGQPQLADDGTGYLVAMDGVWSPNASAPTSPAPVPLPPVVNGAGTALTPLFSFPAVSTPARVTGNNALVRLACGTGGAACKGTLSIQSAKAAGAHVARAAKAVTYATGSFALTAGEQHAVKAKLSRTGRALASRHKRLKVWLNVTLNGGSAPTIMSRRVTLRF